MLYKTIIALSALALNSVQANEMEDACQAGVDALSAFTVDALCESTATGYATSLATVYSGLECSAADDAVAGFAGITTCTGLADQYSTLCTAVADCVGDSDPCFPSDAKVTKADGSLVNIDTLKEGDKIVAATAEGVLTTDTVSLLSIKQPEAQAKSLLTLTTADKTLTLTPEHHVPVGAECCSNLKQAKDIVLGDKVWAVKDGAAAASTVTAISKTQKKGLHSPVLTNGGFPVVDGLVTSFDSIEKVRLAKFGLAPLLATCKASGTCDTFKEMFLAGDRKYVEALRRVRL